MHIFDARGVLRTFSSCVGTNKGVSRPMRHFYRDRPLNADGVFLGSALE